MAAENPRNTPSFSQIIREGTVHPTLESRRSQAAAINRQVEALPPDKIKYKQLIPAPEDQGLIVTAHDNFSGLVPEIAPAEAQDAWFVLREQNLRIANHPERIAAMQRLKRKGFTRPPEMEGVLDRALAEKRPLQLSDLAQNTDFARLGLHFDPSQESHEEFIERLSQSTQVHRTETLAQGPFSFVGKEVRSFVGTGAMPDVMGSVHALEIAAKMGMLAEIPEVGKFSDPKLQQALAKKAVERLLEHDETIFAMHTPETIAYLRNLWIGSLVGVLEVDPKKALDRASLLAEVGIRSFRIYGHTQGGDVVKTTQALRNKFPDAEIFASQITNVETAQACEFGGADAVIIGVGSGGRCSTADKAQLIPSNAHLAWLLRGKLGIPVIGEGGAIDEPLVAALVGMSGVNGSGSLGGGTFEAPGGAYFFRNKQGDLEKPYGGEASERAKELSRRTYGSGLPYFTEGSQTFRPLTRYGESMTQKVLEVWENICLGLVVMGIHDAWDAIGQLHRYSPSPLYEKSGTTQYLQKPH